MAIKDFELTDSTDFYMPIEPFVDHDDYIVETQKDRGHGGFFWKIHFPGDMGAIRGWNCGPEVKPIQFYMYGDPHDNQKVFDFLMVEVFPHCKGYARMRLYTPGENSSWFITIKEGNIESEREI